MDGDQVSRDQAETGYKEDDDVKDMTKRNHVLGNVSRVRKGNYSPYLPVYNSVCVVIVTT